MNKQKGLAPMLIVLIITVALGGYIIYKNQSKPVNVTQLNANSSTTNSDNKISWKIYTSPKYGYSFNYPLNWTVVDAGSAEGTVTEIYSWTGERENGFDGRRVKKSEMIIEIYEIPNPDKLTVQQWYIKDQTQNPNYQKKPLKEENITVNDMNGVKRILQDPDGYEYINVDLAYGNKIYRIFGVPTNTYSTEYEEIVQSFRHP